jgi:hypothetical protein
LATHFQVTTEKACKRGGTRFVSLSKNAQDTGQSPSPGQTDCGPKSDDAVIELTEGEIFFVSTCSFNVILTSKSISINPLSGSDLLPQTNSSADGIRVNADCSFDFVTF